MPMAGYKNTRLCPQDEVPPMPQVLPGINNNTLSINDEIDNDSEDSMPFVQLATYANVIESNDDSTSNVFIFNAFADKRTGILYSNLTGTFPFMFLEGNVCFRAVYHYKSNAILALRIAIFANNTILAAYQQQFKLFESKGHKIKVNVMDNQASKVIKNISPHNNAIISSRNPTITG
jgi:hypothetical protein